MGESSSQKLDLDSLESTRIFTGELYVLDQLRCRRWTVHPGDSDTTHLSRRKSGCGFCLRLSFRFELRTTLPCFSFLSTPPSFAIFAVSTLCVERYGLALFAPGSDCPGVYGHIRPVCERASPISCVRHVALCVSGVAQSEALRFGQTGDLVQLAGRHAGSTYAITLRCALCAIARFSRNSVEFSNCKPPGPPSCSLAAENHITPTPTKSATPKTKLFRKMHVKRQKLVFRKVPHNRAYCARDVLARTQSRFDIRAHTPCAQQRM